MEMAIRKDHQGTFNAIKTCLGKTVCGIGRIQSYFNGNENEDGFGDLEIRFEDNSFLTLTGMGDADSIKAVNESAIIPEPFRVNENQFIFWKRIDLKSEWDWMKIIGQKLHNAEVEWNIYTNIENNITACVLYFDSDFVTFYETGSDANKFFVNKKLPEVEVQTRREIII
jgi:hypothetical protein